MAKMLRNTPGGRWWVCRCRHCRGDDRRGSDSVYRRAQRAREGAQWRREATQEAWPSGKAAAC